MAFYRKATEVRISTALLALLQAGSFEYPVTFFRAALPILKAELLTSTKAVVVPARKTGEPADRARDVIAFDIGIAFGKTVGLEATSTREQEIERLQALVEEVSDYVSLPANQILELPEIEGLGGATVQDSHSARLRSPYQLDPIFDARLLREEGVFFSVPIFTYYFEAIRE